MLLVSELADMICQVLAAGTWGSRKHRHDLSSGAPVRVAVCTACVHTAATCIHTEKVYYQELHTPAAVLCASECHPECGPVKGPSRQNAAHAAEVIQVRKRTKTLTHTSRMSHFFP